jgi:hypothetical protein
MADLSQMLGSLFAGMPSGQAAPMLQPAQPMPQAAPQAAPMPQDIPPMVVPPNGPMPTPRPAMPLPQNGPMPTPRPQMPPQQPMQAPMQAAPQPMQARTAQRANPLMALLSGNLQGGDMRNFLGSIGAGLGSIDPTNDDPFSTFGRSLSGATSFYQTREDALRDQEIAAQKTAFDQGNTTADNARMSQELALRQAAERRAAKSADLGNKKTEMEIERMAKGSGLTVPQMLEIERIAQAAGENIFDTDERARVVEAKRKQLMETYGSPQGVSGRGGLSDGKGLSADQTATNPKTGERIRYDAQSQQWVPIQ